MIPILLPDLLFGNLDERTPDEGCRKCGGPTCWGTCFICWPSDPSASSRSDNMLWSLRVDQVAMNLNPIGMIYVRDRRRSRVGRIVKLPKRYPTSREAKKAYRDRNLEKTRAASRARYAKNRGRILAQRRAAYVEALA